MFRKKINKDKHIKQQFKEDENFVPKAFKKHEEVDHIKTPEVINNDDEFSYVENDKIDIKRKRRDEHSKHHKFPKLKNKKIKKVIIIILLIIILAFAIWLGIATHVWKMLAKDMLLQENSLVKDTNGNIIATIGSEKKKKYIKLSEMPENLKKAYVAIEDERFYSHGGVDIKRTAAAIGSYIFHFGSSSYGGSTITQQLVKNLTGDNTDNITRKVKEWWKASQLETCMSKDEILEAYLNIIYVGPNIYGVEAGGKYYFNKSAKDLKLSECAFLAGINNSPNSYNPFIDNVDNDKIKKRTKIVLTKMKELKYINENDYNQAIIEVDKGLPFKKGAIDVNDSVYSYHTDALITEIIEDIQKKYNISETFAKNYIEMAGSTIYSTQNSNIQIQMETEFSKSKYSLASKIGNSSSQAAMVVIDHKTGNVLGCVGGLGKKKESRSFNRATQSVRQTGSAIKPIAVLAPAIDKKVITAASVYDDVEKDFGNGYRPIDYSKPLGKVTIRRALESSQNIPFVEIMQKLKPKTSIKYLKKMGVTTLTKKDESLPLSLGGLDKGISPLEMAGAYSTIANDGEYIEPTFYSKIDRKNGKNLIKTTQKKKRVFSKEVAYILKNLLTQPVQGQNGTATYCKISGVDVAAKTGTTDDNYDRWLCGFTPYYTAATWYGYDKNETIEFNKRNPAGLIWANVMSRIHVGKPKATFDKPSNLTSCKICSKTGKKARSGCTDTYIEYFLWFTAPGLCDEHTGSEITDNDYIKDVQDKGHEIIQDIKQDIDAVDPQELLPKDDTTNQNSDNKGNTTINKPNNDINTNNIKNTTNTNSSNASNKTNSSNTNNKTNVTNNNTSANTNSSNSVTSNQTTNNLNTNVNANTNY